jgi:hypothetical protein
VALRRQLTRAQVLPFFERLPATVVAMEACGAGHHWARELRRLGHEVRLKKRCFNPTESAKPCNGLLTGYAEQTENDPPVTLQSWRVETVHT